MERWIWSALPRTDSGGHSGSNTAFRVTAAGLSLGHQLRRRNDLHFQTLQPHCLCRGDVRDNQKIRPVRVSLPEGLKVARVRFKSAPLALVGIHRLPPARHHEVHLALLVVSPEQYLCGILDAQERVKHQMLPE